MCHIIEIYVVCPALCKPGIPYGKWINATKPLDEIQDEIKAMLADSPTPDAKAFKVRNTHDPTGYDIVSGIDDIKVIHKIALFVQKHGDLGAALLEETSSDVQYATSLIEEAYCGQFESEKDFVYDLLEDTCTIDDWLMMYLDLEWIWQDLQVNDYIGVRDMHGTYHVFHRL